MKNKLLSRARTLTASNTEAQELGTHERTRRGEVSRGPHSWNGNLGSVESALWCLPPTTLDRTTGGRSVALPRRFAIQARPVWAQGSPGCVRRMKAKKASIRMDFHSPRCRIPPLCRPTRCLTPEHKATLSVTMSRLSINSQIHPRQHRSRD